MAIRVFIVWRFGKAKQFFLGFLDAFHVFVEVHLAIAIENRACGGAHDLICLGHKGLDRKSKRDEILDHGELVANLLNGDDAMHEALEDERYLLLLLWKV